MPNFIEIEKTERTDVL